MNFEFIYERFILGCHAGTADVGSDGFENERRDGQIKESIGGWAAFVLNHLLIEHFEISSGVIATRKVAIGLPKGLVALLFLLLDFHVLVALGPHLLHLHVRTGVSIEDCVLGQ